MVGKIKGISLARITSQLMSKDYVLGEIDCFMIVYKYMKDMIPNLPEEYQSLNIHNYIDHFKNNPETTKQIMIEAIKANLVEISPLFSVAGDILYLSYRQKDKFLGIDAGHGKVIVVAPSFGVVPINKDRYTILGAFKCQLLSHCS